MIKVKNTLEGKLNASIVKEYPELEEITVMPTLEGQELEPSKYGYSKITVKAIPATDIEMTPTREKQVKTGIFKEVVVNEIEKRTLNLNPSEEQQSAEGVFTQVNINPIQVEEITTDLDFSTSDEMELTAKEGVYIKKAIINKDVNLTPENIKSGVSVCGIAGDVADTSDADATSNDILLNKTAYVANEKIRGTYEPLDTSDATATAEDIAIGKTAYAKGIKLVGAMKKNVEVITSYTEPVGADRKPIWIQKGKNLYYGERTFGFINDSGDWVLETTSSVTSMGYFEVSPLTDYVVSFLTSSTTILNVVIYYDENANFIGRLVQSGRKQFVTPENCRYVRLVFNKNGGTGDISNIQLEQGLVATEYEKHVSSKIYVKNENDEYEEY